MSVINYRINNVIPQFYNNTLFGLLNNQQGGEIINQNYISDYAPNADIDVKEENKSLGIKKTFKGGTQEKVKEDIVCDQCGKTFKDKKACKDHIRVQHEKKKIYKCRQCKKSYSYRGGLIDHRKICKGPLGHM